MDSDARVGPTSFLGVAVFAAAFALALAFFFSFTEPFALRGDNKFVHFPMKLEAWRQWTSGHVPFWTNGLWSGFPLFGDVTTGALYLPHALAFLTTPDPHLRAFDVAVAMHAGWLAAGSVVLLRRLGASASSAIFGAVLSLLASHVLGWTAYLPGFSTLSWWPWALVGADRLARAEARAMREVLRATVLASVPLGAQVLAGYPETALYSGCAAAAWIALMPGGPPLAGRLARIAGLAAAAALLAGPQLIPGAFATFDSTRAVASEMRGLLSIQGSLFDVVDPTVGSRQLAVLSPFLGAATLVLALAALVMRSRGSVLLAAIALLAALASLGDRTFVYGLASQIPFFEFFRGPHKFFLITQLFVIWLAALGLSGLLRRGSRKLAVAGAVLAALAIFEHAGSFASHLPRVSSGHTAGELEISQAVELLREVAPVLVEPASQPGVPARIFTGSYLASIGSLPMLVGAESVRGAGVALLSPRHQWLRDGYIGPVHLDLLGVELLFLQGKCETSRFSEPIVLRGERFCVRRNPDARPRYELVGRVRRRALDEMTEEMRRRTPPPVVGVDAPVEVPLPHSSGAPVGLPGDVAISSYRPGRVELRVRAEGGNRMLIVRESWAPGWSARVDGEPAPIHPAAALFFAVPVPEGSHTVELEFTAPGFGIGMALGTLWLGIAALAFISRPRAAD